ncbi:MAG: tRNA 2-thiouridine(34) synthase MnmA [Candidatus Taylorbacteria bacterium RIFOXYD2_FULL_36_9]|uniref:tRNA-specific 2-thiouridylase MnmA n=1 Tax=Candidatus Taylorbacteria bacterium RIFOXYD2_FULL_36_9 TaxID=1802338 RepID=A0A1G2PDT4_9BACT|nr:MAG: tRNA 2-thiouridine(34) synthase MnmA [Candidatus Taylorbacteria bacterium RIFOXYD2_FULL_36_9]
MTNPSTKLRTFGKRKVVFVGLSGGVDSSVSAALLKKAGFEVSGVFIKVWQPDFWGGCSLKEDRLDAMRVCAKLRIPFYTLDLEKEYKEEVVDYMVAEYKAGRTPNPDVMCNKYVKFGGFFDWAMRQGADFVATGHYARIAIGQQKWLLAGKDKNKDQSYFLWTLTQKQLARTLFPVGDLEKPQVRRLAKKFGLETAEKKDSQGLCFIGKIEMTDFLKHFIKTKPGSVLNEKGEIIGIHQGVELYTLGQRHGFEITKKTNKEERYFIVSKDLKKNTLMVSHNPKPSVAFSKSDKATLGFGKEIKLKEVNWILGVKPDLKKEYSARIRYRQPLEKCHLQCQGSTLTVRFKKAQKAPTPGQSVVIYDACPDSLSGRGDICLCGGIIE